MASSETITVVGSGIAGSEFCVFWANDEAICELSGSGVSGSEFCVFCANDEAICVFSENDEAADMNDEAADFGSTGDLVGL